MVKTNVKIDSFYAELMIKDTADECKTQTFPSDLLLGRFYDLNGDGCITRQEMLVIVSAIYEMMQSAQTIQSVINKQVDRFFEKMDANRDGIVSREEFMSGCKNVREYPTMS